MGQYHWMALPTLKPWFFLSYVTPILYEGAYSTINGSWNRIIPLGRRFLTCIRNDLRIKEILGLPLGNIGYLITLQP